VKVARVRSRDGTIVPFERRRIEAAVARAAERTGEEDPHAAIEVADLVEMALGRRYALGRSRGVDQSVPDVAEIEDLIEEALVELGHAGIAKAYILERARDARVRAVLEDGDEDAPERSEAVAKPRGDGAAGQGREDASQARRDAARAARRAPRVLVAGGVEAWSRARIVAALVSEADVPRALAEDVAAKVEERVFASGLKRVSTALVRELVDNDLVERGLAEALRRTRPVGMPRHDLSRWIAAGEPEAEPGAAAPRALEARVAGELLRRFAHEDVLPEALQEALADGEFGLEDLDRVHLDLAVALPCELLAAGEFEPLRGFELLEDLARAAARTARGVVLEDCGTLLSVLTRTPRSVAPDRLASWLVALAAVSRACGRTIDLAPRLRPRERGPAVPPWLERFVEDLVEAEADGPRTGLARTFVDASELVAAAASSPALERGVELCLARGRIVPTFGSATERAVAPGLVRGARERGALALRAAVTLNLPRAARRAGPWREDALFEDLHGAVARGLDALCALRDLRRGASGSGPRARVGYAVVPVGLREALAWLGDGEVRPEAAARLLAFLSEAAKRLGQERGLAVALCGTYGERDAQRFAALDARRQQVVQPSLFQAGESARTDSAYSSGLDLVPGSSNPVERIEAAADAAASLACGVLDAPGFLRAIALPGEGRAPLLSGLEAFERERVRRRVRTGGLYALPPATESSLYSEEEVPTAER